MVTILMIFPEIFFSILQYFEPKMQ